MKELSREKQMELQMLDAQARLLAEQLDKVETSLMEAEYIKNCISDLKKVKKGTEILAPLSNGIFVKAKLEDGNMLLINSGKDVVVEKSAEESKSLLDERIKEMSEVRNKLLEEMQKIENKLISFQESS
jgi:prefoldin alpha subunit